MSYWEITDLDDSITESDEIPTRGERFPSQEQQVQGSETTGTEPLRVIRSEEEPHRIAKKPNKECEKPDDNKTQFDICRRKCEKKQDNKKETRLEGSLIQSPNKPKNGGKKSTGYQQTQGTQDESNQCCSKSTEPLKAQLLNVINSMGANQTQVVPRYSYMGTSPPVRLEHDQESVVLSGQVEVAIAKPHSVVLESNEEARDLDSVVSTLGMTNTVNSGCTFRLPSTSSGIREGRTADFLHDGWYHNMYYQDTDGEYSVLCSSARQMNNNMKEHLCTDHVVCDSCRLTNEIQMQQLQQQQLRCFHTAQQPIAATMNNLQETYSNRQVPCDGPRPRRMSVLRSLMNSIRGPMRRSFDPSTAELYRMNICEPNDQNLPKRVVFDLIDGQTLFRPKMVTIGTNTMGMRSPLSPQRVGLIQQQTTSARVLYTSPSLRGGSQQSPICGGTQGCLPPPNEPMLNCSAGCSHGQGKGDCPSILERLGVIRQEMQRQDRIDVYYFDHGNASYYRTTDSPGTIYTEMLAQRTEQNTAQYWAEIFGTIHIGFALFTSFFLQLYRFILQSSIRPLLIGLVQLTSDYCFKPLLALLFNAVLQPILIYLYNAATSFRDLCEPIADAFGFFLREVAILIRAFRLVEVRHHHHRNSFPETV